MTADRTKSRRRAGIAWLAVLALLINALVPASLAATVAGHGREAGSGWCGSGPGGQQPAKDAGPAICNHCILCSAASGFAPAVAAGVGILVPVITAARGVIAPARPLLLSAYSPSQPRGPPVAARI